MTIENPRRNLIKVIARHASGMVHNPDIQIIRDLFYLAFGQVTTKLVGFFLYAYMARVISPRDYGALETMLAIFAFAAMVVDFGLGSSAVRYRAQQSTDKDLTVGIVPALRMVLVVPSIVGSWIAIIIMTQDPVVRNLGGLLTLTLVLQVWRQEWLLQSLEMVRAVSFGQFLRVAVLGVVAMILIRESSDFVWFGLAECVAGLVTTVFYLIIQRRAGFSLRLRFKRSIAEPLFRQAFPLGLTAVVWSLVQSLPTLIVGAVAGLEQAAYLAVAQRLATSLQSISYLYHFNMFAALSRRYHQGTEHLQRLSLASMRLAAWASIGPAAICAIYASDIITTIYGPNYGEASSVLAVVIFIVPMQLLSGHHRWALAAAGETRSVLFGAFVGAALTALVSLATVSEFGAVGGAIAGLSAGLGIWLVAYFACRTHGLPLPILSRIWRPSLCAVVAILPEFAYPHIPVLLGLFTSFALYSCLAVIVDKSRIFSDLRHFAYAKKNR